MSADSYSLFYCLNESGWSLMEEETSVPGGWVRVYEGTVYQGSPFGRESRKWNLIKTHPNTTEQEANALEEKFPRPQSPRGLSSESFSRIFS